MSREETTRYERQPTEMQSPMMMEGVTQIEETEKDATLTSKFSLRNNRFMTVKYGGSSHWL